MDNNATNTFSPSEAKRELHEEHRRAARQAIRRGANNLGGCSSGSTLRLLFEIGDAFSDIAPFWDEASPFRQNAGFCEADLAEAELDPKKWGDDEDGSEWEGALADLDAVLDPRRWGANTDGEPGKSPAAPSRPPRIPGEGGALANLTIVAAHYEKEAADARNSNGCHALNDLHIRTYNNMIRASNEVSQLWEGKAQTAAYDLVKTLVFRMVIADDELARPVLSAAAAYLGNIRARIRPLTDLRLEETGLQPPANGRG